jgi:hypothetical protein
VATSQATEGDRRVAVLGTAMDLVTSETALDVISRTLVRQLAVSYEDYLDALDWICGRYLLISQDENTTRIQTDATGMRSVFYSSESTVVASHAHLVASLTDAGPSEFADPAWETKNSVSYLPGLVTVHDGVRQLTPNTELILESMTVRRIYPRRNLEPLYVEEIVERVHPILKSQVVALARWTPLVMSLTAGIDSRTSLALARPVVDQLDTFTYQTEFGRFKSKAIVSIDPITAAAIATSLGIRHRVVRIDNDVLDADLREILATNVHHEHIWPLAQWYLNNLSGEILHVRSNLYEIGRCFWRKSRPRELPLNSERMALTHRPSFPSDARAVTAFDDLWRQRGSKTSRASTRTTSSIGSIEWGGGTPGSFLRVTFHTTHGC